MVVERLAQLDAQHLHPLDTEAIVPVRHVFGWHPSEASGLLAAAAAGLRGRVEVRDAGDHVEMTNATTLLSAVDAKRAAYVTPATHLADAASLDEAEQTIREVTGISAIAYETEKAARLTTRRAHQPTAADLPAVDRFADDALARGADLISVRRLSEFVGATTLAAFDALSDLLSTDRAERYKPPLYRTACGRHLGR